MVDWALRPASVMDVEAVAELRAAALRPDLERLGRYDEQRVRQRLRDGFTPAHTWMIEVDGALAGCVALRPAKHTYWLEHFYLDPDLQGRGIGTAVLSRLLEWCDREDAVVRLNVLQGSSARQLYERHGFTAETEDEVDVFMVRHPSSPGDHPAETRPGSRASSLRSPAGAVAPAGPSSSFGLSIDSAGDRFVVAWTACCRSGLL
ncbi:GNAT family N-acetyltransferase [Nonomuraea cavernae]|uniref:GNAT family N-acetyltransferase n=1 Tax=Nonomuraea cavernae TaxID=2045107 RepID=UPI0033EDBA8F